MSPEEITERIQKHITKLDADIERKKYELHLQDALAKKEQELRDRIAKAVCLFFGICDSHHPNELRACACGCVRSYICFFGDAHKCFLVRFLHLYRILLTRARPHTFAYTYTYIFVGSAR